MAELFDMGGYGQWIWSAYGLAFAVMIGMIVQSLRMARLNRRRLDEVGQGTATRPDKGT
ncbi:MAG: heme exporter protein CcmD [Pseudomonadota bacterium]